MDTRENRCRILDAAARVYALLGFRGATTRRIAEAAGVNEVTLFRTFGSKEALIAEALRARATSQSAPLALPADPQDPERELTAWAAAHLAELRASRALIRQAMSDMGERPEVAPCVASGWSAADAELRRYLVRLVECGFVDAPRPVTGPTLARYDDVFAGGAMLMAALFSDAMGRDMMPEMFPQPADRAPVLYVSLFLRAVRCRPSREEAPAARTGDGGPRPRARRRAS
ncbi:TetR/AcrR family transcriptional regulator [Roseisolibacter sp. H3M3-2]|uniref:TetR/AcrR family transcriptional regulator n=1 Tax=Roseisolibacter sp. H3M3-2 TaxID=3031323 RepID=UPI0023DB5617|nr:TetR/AcrR family transcriptional regulator [Roseisolibacter sp. H3M3-2]MDF1505586.1 helix-turn-helix domain containing protein [Roseisolibacter sp. H3M3-2]